MLHPPKQDVVLRVPYAIKAKISPDLFKKPQQKLRKVKNNYSYKRKREFLFVLFLQFSRQCFYNFYINSSLLRIIQEYYFIIKLTQTILLHRLSFIFLQGTVMMAADPPPVTYHPEKWPLPNFSLVKGYLLYKTICHKAALDV